MFNTHRKIWGWSVSSYQFPQPMIQMAGALMSHRFGLKLTDAPPAPTLDSIHLPTSKFTIPAQFSEVSTTDAYHRVVHTYGKAFLMLFGHYQVILVLRQMPWPILVMKLISKSYLIGHSRTMLP